MKRTQSGMTLIGFVIVLAVAGLFIYVGMKLVPMYTEFYSVKQALAAMSNEPGMADKGQDAIRDMLSKRLYMSYTSDIKPEHVKIVREDNGWKVTVDYEARREVIANLDVVGKFHTEKLLNSRAAQ